MASDCDERKWRELITKQAANRRAAVSVSEAVDIFRASARDGTVSPTRAPATNTWSKNFHYEQSP
jgi:hypothetical protein